MNQKIVGCKSQLSFLIIVMQDFVEEKISVNLVLRKMMIVLIYVFSDGELL